MRLAVRTTRMHIAIEDKQQCGAIARIFGQRYMQQPNRWRKFAFTAEMHGSLFIHRQEGRTFPVRNIGRFAAPSAQGKGGVTGTNAALGTDKHGHDSSLRQCAANAPADKTARLRFGSHRFGRAKSPDKIFIAGTRPAYLDMIFGIAFKKAVDRSGTIAPCAAPGIHQLRLRSGIKPEIGGRTKPFKPQLKPAVGAQQTPCPIANRDGCLVIFNRRECNRPVGRQAIAGNRRAFTACARQKKDGAQKGERCRGNTDDLPIVARQPDKQQ